jgi:heterodisulfide reductase subunit C
MDEVFDSRTFWYCSACYTCTLRCPRGVPVTRIMSALKRMSVRLAPKLHRCNQTFYSSFVGNVKKYGRVQETALMLRYFLAMKSLRLPLEFTSLGVKLAARGKVSWPHRDHRGVLKDLFAAVEEQNRRRHGGDAT